jgi:protein-disulfide isomerase/uncharacterized membrane protein
MTARKTQKKIVPLPYLYYCLPVAILCLAGLVDSIYLAVSHYRVYTDMGYQSFCAISRALNCDTVSQSPYSIFFGVPVSVWGIFGYAIFLFLFSFACLKRADKKRIWTLLFAISIGFTVYSIALAVVSTYYVRSYCIMCILSYAVNLLLLYLTWLVRRRFECEPFSSAITLDLRHLLTYPRTFTTGVALSIACVVGLLLYFPTYWQMEPPVLSKNTPVGVTEDGHPWIGAVEPEITITEFSDYLCFQCNKMHFYIRQLVENHSDRIRLVHRHFPMDHLYNPLVSQPFHSGSGKMAIIALKALEKNKFWETNDLLFKLATRKEDFNIKAVADQVNLTKDELLAALNSRFLRFRLKHDIAIGIDQGITGTPAFVINGKVYTGTIPKDIIDTIISEDD